jgi:hypothetical protein
VTPSACPFCGARWAAERWVWHYPHDCDAAALVRLAARCPACHARVQAAGTGDTTAEADASAELDFAARWRARLGTDASGWVNRPRQRARR